MNNKEYIIKKNFYDYYVGLNKLLEYTFILIDEFEIIVQKDKLLDIRDRYGLKCIEQVYLSNLIINLHNILLNSYKNKTSCCWIELFLSENTDVKDCFDKIYSKENIELFKKLKNNRNHLEAHLDIDLLGHKKLSNIEREEKEKFWNVSYDNHKSSCTEEEVYGFLDMIRDLQRYRKILKSVLSLSEVTLKYMLDNGLEGIFEFKFEEDDRPSYIINRFYEYI